MGWGWSEDGVVGVGGGVWEGGGGGQSAEMEENILFSKICLRRFREVQRKLGNYVVGGFDSL